MALVSVLTLGSCSDGFGGWESDEEGDAEVKIELFTRTDDALTRATLGETAATGPELINSWWVAFVDRHGEVAKIATGTPANPTSMDIINTILPAGSYTAYAFANITQEELKSRAGIFFEEGTNAPSATEISEATISLKNGSINSATGQANIPMTGKLEIKAKGGINEPYSIEVVRVLGKVEFAFANMTEEPVKVKSISFGLLHEGPVSLLPNYNTLATPNEEGVATEMLDGSTPAGEIDGRTGLLYFKHDLSDNAPEVTKSETAAISDEEFKRDEQFTLYVRETSIPGKSSADDAQSDCCWFRLEVEHGGKAKTIYAKVKDLTFINRNDHILIPVRMRISTDHELTVDVLPYRSVILRPDFGLKLGALNLDKGVIRLYTDDNKQTASSGTVTALDEDGNLITEGLTWTLGNVTDSHVCDIKDNKDGTCTVTPIVNKRGRDVLIATIRKNGIEIKDECIIQVSDRHLSLNKTFLGLTPQGNGIKHHIGEFLLTVVAETDEHGKLSWELLDSDGKPSNLDVKVSVKVDGKEIENGGVFAKDEAEITVTSSEMTGTAYLRFTYEGPKPGNTGGREQYSSYCEIMVQKAVLNCFPKETSVIMGQTTTFTTTILPKFSDLIPSVKYLSSDPSIATVDENGVVTGIMPGDVTITVYNDTDFAPEKVSDTVKVKVVPNSLVLTREDGETSVDHVEILNTETFTIKAMSGDVNRAMKDISESVTWEIVEKDKFITINKGVVTPVAGAKGTNTVLATYKAGENTLTARCIVVVSDKYELIIDEHPHGISIEGEIPLKAHVFPDSRPYDQRDYDITWTSADESIISIRKDKKDGKYYAVAKDYGKTTVTAKTTYNGTELTATTYIEVVKEREREPLQLFIYDSKGEFVCDITSVDAKYPGPPEVTAIPDITDVGGLGLFDKINIPKGETWTAKIVINEDPQASLTNPSWTTYQRYSFHNERIELKNQSADGKSCEIFAKELGSDAATRYNEVIFKCQYKGKEYTRRFCVYTPDK